LSAGYRTGYDHDTVAQKINNVSKLVCRLDSDPSLHGRPLTSAIFRRRSTFGRRRVVGDNWNCRYLPPGLVASRTVVVLVRRLEPLGPRLMRRRDLQSKQPFNSDVLGQLKQCVESLVLAQRFAVDFDSEC